MEGSPTPGPAPRYQVLEKLRTEAGVIDVYKAVQTGLGRPVELRLLDVEKLGDRSEMLRFEREFRTLATLDHPLLYKVLDWGKLDNRAFYVTDWRSTKTLEQLLGEGFVFGPAELFSLAFQLADALAYLHEKGVVHRSVGVQSVLYDPARDQTAIAEFPMVKDTRLADLTAQGVGSLAPALSTPELLRRQPASPATDIFLLGALLYRLHTRREPYSPEAYQRLDRLDAAAFASLIQPLDAGQPEPRARARGLGFENPSSKIGLAPGELNTSAIDGISAAAGQPGRARDGGKTEGLPAGFCRLVMRCLAFEPSSRPPSARAFLEDLGAAETEGRTEEQKRRRQARRQTGDFDSTGAGSKAVPGLRPRAASGTDEPSALPLVMAGVAAAVAALALLLWWLAG